MKSIVRVSIPTSELLFKVFLQCESTMLAGLSVLCFNCILSSWELSGLTQGAYQPHREDMEGRTGGLSATQGVYGGGQGAYPPRREDMEGDRGPISHTADMEGD